MKGEPLSVQIARILQSGGNFKVAQYSWQRGGLANQRAFFIFQDVVLRVFNQREPTPVLALPVKPYGLGCRLNRSTNALWADCAKCAQFRSIQMR